MTSRLGWLASSVFPLSLSLSFIYQTLQLIKNSAIVSRMTNGAVLNDAPVSRSHVKWWTATSCRSLDALSGCGFCLQTNMADWLHFYTSGCGRDFLELEATSTKRPIFWSFIHKLCVTSATPVFLFDDGTGSIDPFHESWGKNFHSSCFNNTDACVLCIFFSSFKDGKHHMLPGSGDLYIYGVDKSDTRTGYRCRTRHRFHANAAAAHQQLSSNAASITVSGSQSYLSIRIRL